MPVFAGACGKGLGDGCSTIDNHVLYGSDSLAEIFDGRYIRTWKMDSGRRTVKGTRTAFWIAFVNFGAIVVLVASKIVALYGHIFHKGGGQTVRRLPWGRYKPLGPRVVLIRPATSQHNFYVQMFPYRHDTAPHGEAAIPQWHPTAYPRLEVSIYCSNLLTIC